MGVNRDLDQNGSNDGKIDIGGFNAGGTTVEEKLADLILQPMDKGTLIGGKVGIGTWTPEYTLDVYGDVRFKHKLFTGGTVGIGTITPEARLHVVSPAGAYGILSEVPSNGFKAFAVKNQGQVTFKVQGDGQMYATEAWLSQPTSFPDYVFEPNYKKMEPEAIRTFVKKEKHLPGIPSAKEVAQNGIGVGQFQTAHLKTTEELYLHFFDLKDEVDALKEIVKQLQEENKQLKELIRK